MGKRKGRVKREGDEGGRGRGRRKGRVKREGEGEEKGERPDGAEGGEDSSFE